MTFVPTDRDPCILQLLVANIHSGEHTTLPTFRAKLVAYKQLIDIAAESSTTTDDQCPDEIIAMLEDLAGQLQRELPIIKARLGRIQRLRARRHRRKIEMQQRRVTFQVTMDDRTRGWQKEAEQGQIRARMAESARRRRGIAKRMLIEVEEVRMVMVKLDQLCRLQSREESKCDFERLVNECDERILSLRQQLLVIDDLSTARDMVDADQKYKTIERTDSDIPAIEEGLDDNHMDIGACGNVLKSCSWSDFEI